VSPVEVGKNGKTYEEAFASFRDEVLDILDMERTGEKFKRELLSKIVLWHPTGFFPVLFRTRGAALRRPGAKLDRDHVYTRKFLEDQIFAGANLGEIFQNAGMLCYVTPKEHERLGLYRARVGWDRYLAAGIKWYDIAEQPA